MAAKILSALAAALVLLAAAAAQAAEAKKLGFRHTASKELHLDCDENADAKAAHTCYDRDGNETKITEGKEWERINFEKVCFRHEDDRIRVCLEITAAGSGAKNYVCYNDRQRYFQPGAEWTLLPGGNAVCTKQIEHYEVPKTMRFSIGME